MNENHPDLYVRIPTHGTTLTRAHERCQTSPPSTLPLKRARLRNRDRMSTRWSEMAQPRRCCCSFFACAAVGYSGAV